jgi:hypothetical protein
MFCLSVAVFLQIRRTSNSVQDIATKKFGNFRQHCGHRQANGPNHSSRGQRRRFMIEKMFAL